MDVWEKSIYKRLGVEDYSDVDDELFMSVKDPPREIAESLRAMTVTGVAVSVSDNR